MILTKGQAKRLWCPFAHIPGSPKSPGAIGNRSQKGEPPKGTMCLADACMFWRWADAAKDRGYCGHVGRPDIS